MSTCVHRLGLAVALTLTLGWAPAQAGNGRLAVVVSRDTAISALSESELQLIFKRKRRLLADGTLARPVNLPSNHAARRTFSEQVLHRSPEEMEDYWHRQYFNGITPPFVAGSEEAVLRLVASTPGAIGYVPMCLADHRVKVVATVEDGPDCPKGE
jgi:ABC-type phosphate transport system substrate-binding protein